MEGSWNHPPPSALYLVPYEDVEPWTRHLYVWQLSQLKYDVWREQPTAVEGLSLVDVEARKLFEFQGSLHWVASEDSTPYTRHLLRQEGIEWVEISHPTETSSGVALSTIEADRLLSNSSTLYWVAYEDASPYTRVLFAWDGSTWTEVDYPTVTDSGVNLADIDVYRMKMHGPTLYWVAQQNGSPYADFLFAYVGGGWTQVNHPTEADNGVPYSDIDSFSVFSGGDVFYWLAQENQDPYTRHLLAFDGAAWSEVSIPTQAANGVPYGNLNVGAIKAMGSVLLWSAQENQAPYTRHLLTWDGQTWSEVEYPTQTSSGVWLSNLNMNDAVFAGSHLYWITQENSDPWTDYVYAFDGEAWSEMEIPRTSSAGVTFSGISSYSVMGASTDPIMEGSWNHPPPSALYLVPYEDVEPWTRHLYVWQAAPVCAPN
jgi:hypothetical protein